MDKRGEVWGSSWAGSVTYAEGEEIEKNKKSTKLLGEPFIAVF